jgi:hypothetical protein
MDAPGHCSPSRNVVSKIQIWSLMFSSFAFYHRQTSGK